MFNNKVVDCIGVTAPPGEFIFPPIVRELSKNPLISNLQVKDAPAESQSAIKTPRVVVLTALNQILIELLVPVKLLTVGIVVDI